MQPVDGTGLVVGACVAEAAAALVRADIAPIVQLAEASVVQPVQGTGLVVVVVVVGGHAWQMPRWRWCRRI